MSWLQQIPQKEQQQAFRNESTKGLCRFGKEIGQIHLDCVSFRSVLFLFISYSTLFDVGPHRDICDFVPIGLADGNRPIQSVFDASIGRLAPEMMLHSVADRMGFHRTWWSLDRVRQLNDGDFQHTGLSAKWTFKLVVNKSVELCRYIANK